MSNARSGVEGVGCGTETPEEGMIMLDTETEMFCGVGRLPREMASAGPSAYLAIEIEVDMAKQVVSDMTGTALPGTGMMRHFRRISPEGVEA